MGLKYNLIFFNEQFKCHSLQHSCLKQTAGSRWIINHFLSKHLLNWLFSTQHLEQLKKKSYYFRIFLLEILQMMAPMAEWNVDAFFCSGGNHWDSKIPNKTGAFLKEEFFLQYTFIYLAFFIRMHGGVFLLKCIILYYSDVNWGNENWGKYISENENHLKTLHKGGNKEVAGWILSLTLIMKTYWD